MEKLMQYVWQYSLWPHTRMETTDHRRISVINPGIINHDSGPDFSNASIRIGDEHWFGNVEIHVRASDWFRHGHDRDTAYDSVILHVVEINDAEIHRSNGEVIPQLVMTCSRDFSQRFADFINNPSLQLPCGADIPALPSVYISDWITSLGMERLQTKSDRILSMVRQSGGAWSDAIYITLARALGFGTNAEPFELLAKTTPLKFLRRHSDDCTALEAMLFGQAGLLDCPITGNDYLDNLRREYAFYSAKYGLQPSPNIQWKMARMRPHNFPHRRIATLALLVYNNFSFSYEIMDIQNELEARNLFTGINQTGFWTRHFNFSAETVAGARAFSDNSITVLIINVVIPLIYAYGCYTDSPTRCEQAIEMLYNLKAESNNIISTFQSVGISAENAFCSQALIQLHKEYCQTRKCLFCRLGHRMLSSRVPAG